LRARRKDGQETALCVLDVTPRAHIAFHAGKQFGDPRAAKGGISLSRNNFMMAIVPCLDFWFKNVSGYVLLCLKAYKYKGPYLKLDPNDPPIISLLQEEQNIRDVFFSVCTFNSEKRAASNVLHVPGVWVDMDDRDYTSGRFEAETRLLMFPIRPSFVVLSGNGMHVYWKFDEPQEPSDRVLKILKTVTVALGGDLACADFARLLRVPGTFNCKPIITLQGVRIQSKKEVCIADF